MATVDEILAEFPEPVREIIRSIWESLPTQQREELEALLGQLPIALKPLKDILFLVIEQYKPPFGTKRNIAILGPANVGKSTLYNQFISTEEDKAEV